jgi:hypothetical protein
MEKASQSRQAASGGLEKTQKPGQNYLTGLSCQNKFQRVTSPPEEVAG